MFGRLTYADQQLLLNGYYISGVTAFSSDTDFGLTPIYVAGIGELTQISDKRPIPTVQIEQIITDSDFIFNNLLPNNTTMTGLFRYGNNILSFVSGAMTSYNLSCRINDFVRSSTNIEVYGDYNMVANTGQFNTYTGIPQNVKIPTYGSVTVQLNEAVFDRVVGFNFNVSFSNTPVYSMGSVQPLARILRLPIAVKLTFDLEIESSQLYAVSENICTKYNQNIGVGININCGGPNVSTIGLSGATLSKQTFKGSIGNDATISYEYTSYFNQLPLNINYTNVLLSGSNYVVSGSQSNPGSPFPGEVLGVYLLGGVYNNNFFNPSGNTENPPPSVTGDFTVKNNWNFTGIIPTGNPPTTGSYSMTFSQKTSSQYVGALL